ncbi:MAG TPA: 4'-phosphopantetheinyl transferase superfamily protein [Solirubrobacteraceae bacterium]
MTAHLAALTGRAPADVAIRRDAAGRPFLDPPGPDFSVSHSGDVLLVAVAAGEGRVGADVERLRQRPRMERMAEARFPPPVAAAIRAARDERERLARFYAFWTAYEAFAKALGTGLALDPRRLDVTPAGDDGALSLSHPTAGKGPWTGRHLPLDGALACVVAAAPRCAVRRHKNGA